MLTRLLLAFVGLLTCLGPTHIKGTLQTESGNQDRRPMSWREQIQYLDPDRTRFTQILSKIDTRPITDPEYKVFEREHASRWTRINNGAGYNSSATSMTVDDGTMFRVGDVVKIHRTNEHILVGGVSATAITSLTRGYQGSTAAAVNDNDWVKLLYSKEEEYGQAPEIISTDYTTVTNFAQIFKRAYGVSGTDSATKKRGPKNEVEERKRAMELIREDMEQAFLWGRKMEDTTSGETVRFTGGIDQFITTNRIDLGGGIGWGDIGYLMNVATRYGSSRKIWLCGRDARQQIDSLGIQYVEIKQSESKLGMAVQGFRTSFGDVMLLTHHGLDNAVADRIVVIDPEHIAIAELRALKHQKNIQENDRDGRKHQFLAELGLWLDTEKAHMMVTGVTAKVV